MKAAFITLLTLMTATSRAQTISVEARDDSAPRSLPTESAQSSTEPAMPSQASSTVVTSADVLAATMDLGNLDLSALLDLKVSAASLKAEAVESAPAVVTLFRAADIERYQLRSVADVLALTPGLDVLYDQTFVNVGVRGINGGWNAQGRVLKAIVDGQDASFRPTRGNLLGPEFFPLLAIDRVEVIRGPLSALYGADAFLGVVNVVPASPKELTCQHRGNSIAKATYVNRWGNHGVTLDGLGWLDSRWAGFLLGASWTQARRDGLMLPRSPTNAYERLARVRPSLETHDDHEVVASAFARAELKNLGIGRLRADGLFQHVDRTASFNPNTEPLLNAVEAVYNTVFRISHQIDVSRWLVLDSSVALSHGEPTSAQRYYDDYRQTFVVGRDWIRRSYSSTAVDARMAATATLGSWVATLGADFSNDNERLPHLQLYLDGLESEVANPAGERKTLFNGGAFGQVIWKPIEALKLVGNARVDDHSLYGSQFSWRLGAVWSTRSSLWLKLLAGSSFQAPGTNLLFSGKDARLLGPISSPLGLGPQHATSLELSMTKRLLGYRLELQATLFGERVTDFAKFNTYGGNPTPQNAGTILSAGGELSTSFQANKQTQFFGSVSFAEASFKDNDTGISERTRLYPSLSGRLGGAFEVWPGHLRAFTTIRVIGSRRPDSSNLREASGDYTLSSYAVFDVGVSTVGLRLWGGRGTAISATARNLLNTTYREPGFAGIDTPGAKFQAFLSLKQEL